MRGQLVLQWYKKVWVAYCQPHSCSCGVIGNPLGPSTLKGPLEGRNLSSPFWKSYKMRLIRGAWNSSHSPLGAFLTIIKKFLKQNIYLLLPGTLNLRFIHYWLFDRSFFRMAHSHWCSCRTFIDHHHAISFEQVGLIFVDISRV